MRARSIWVRCSDSIYSIVFHLFCTYNACLIYININNAYNSCPIYPGLSIYLSIHTTPTNTPPIYQYYIIQLTIHAAMLEAHATASALFSALRRMDLLSVWMVISKVLSFISSPTSRLIELSLITPCGGQLSLFASLSYHHHHIIIIIIIIVHHHDHIHHRSS